MNEQIKEIFEQLDNIKENIENAKNIIMEGIKVSENNDDYKVDHDDAYMEGVINHMIEAGINPDTNNPYDYIYFQEMAGRIPGQIKVNKKGKEILIIAVGESENRGVAHFHVFRSESDLRKWKNGACLMFTENRYFDHKNNAETLTKDEMKAMINCLNSKPDSNYLGDSYWQFIINLWNANNPNWEISLNTPMPEYDYKTITRYKEK